jgi:acyl-CoA synthetase (AMP-forming)/AMP-acid ligase II
MTGPAPWAWLKPPPAHLRAYPGTGVWRDRTLAEDAFEWAEKAPDAVVFLDEPRAPTYASLIADAEALAVSMWDLGLRPGEVISFQTPNWVEAAVINLAAALMGLVINPIIIIYRDAEVRQMLTDSGARLIFLCESFRGYDFAAMVARIRPDLPGEIHVATVRGAADGPLSYEAMIEAGRGRRLNAPKVDPDSVKMLLYTSGTTGRPKGVLHSHNTLARAVACGARHWRIQPGEAILMPSPVTHVSGYSNGLELPFLIGTRTVLMEAWQADQALDLIERYDVVGTVAATPFLQELAMKAVAGERKLASLRFFACGGAAVPREIVRTANKAFAAPAAFRVFGSSEVPLVTLGFMGPGKGELAATTDGEIVDYEVRFVDDSGADVPEGAEGEILARGPAMFMGYADQGQTREALTEDGFFRTGDIGLRTTDNALLITGRKKDLIIRGGENLSAKEIEDVLYRHPAVMEAAVVAMPHPRLGEGVAAFVIPVPGEAVDLAALSAFVGASGLANQKRPEKIFFVDSLPRTASGKVRKDLLRAEAKRLVEGV